jgi:hypothetical protein
MGFNEVESCIKEWLEIECKTNPLVLNYNKFGIRQTTDKAISLSNNERIKKLSEDLNKRVLKPNKSILITGSGGYLGQTLIKMLRNSNYHIIAFDLNKQRINILFDAYKNVECVDKNDLINGKIRLGNVDYLIHCGFARPHCTNEEIADSLSFTSELFAAATLNQVSAIINISSQVYMGRNKLHRGTKVFRQCPKPLMPQLNMPQS